jgi:hypothetical protein
MILRKTQRVRRSALTLGWQSSSSDSFSSVDATVEGKEYCSLESRIVVSTTVILGFTYL